MMHRRFAKQLSSLAAMAQFVEEFTNSAGLGFDVTMRLQLVLEELATNMMKYSVGEGREFEIHLAPVDGRVRVELIEPDVDEFNPVANAPDLDSTDMANRRAGGMGLFMVRQMAEIDYRYADRTGFTTLILHTGEADV